MSELMPFLKWAGGKRWLTSELQSHLMRNYDRYIEPFLGGGALFFYLSPKKAVLGDLNADLIETYKVIRDNWVDLERLLRRHQKGHTANYYYKIRQSNPKTAITRAAKFLYLNRTCWNGLYRVNLRGEFNVPIGTKSTVLLGTDNFEAVSDRLKNAEIIVSDFENVIETSRNNDLLFVDPPYTVKHNVNNFRKYNECIFSWDDQIRLRDTLFRARDRGVNIILCNADNFEIRKLYKGFGEMDRVSRHSVLAADANMRRRTTELIITAWPEANI